MKMFFWGAFNDFSTQLKWMAFLVGQKHFWFWYLHRICWWYWKNLNYPCYLLTKFYWQYWVNGQLELLFQVPPMPTSQFTTFLTDMSSIIMLLQCYVYVVEMLFVHYRGVWSLGLEYVHTPGFEVVQFKVFWPFLKVSKWMHIMAVSLCQTHVHSLHPTLNVYSAFLAVWVHLSYKW